MKRFKIIIIILILLTLIINFVMLDYYGFIPKKVYYDDDFNIKRIVSDIDYDNDGIDDYSDILNGAIAYIKTKPKYKSEYYEGGYPPSKIGVCTDVIWYALNNAGYNLKELVDNDIKNNKEKYDIEIPDPNIDFRRVKNLNVFFKENTINLTIDLNDIASFQAGDIVVFENHIAILSDKRNKKGIPYLIHHGGIRYEEDAISRYKLIGHYRFKLINQT